MSTPFVTAESTGSSVREKGKATESPLSGFLRQYFYFSMSLLLTGLVVWGFSKTVDSNLFHAAPAKPFLLWIHGAVFSGWMIFFIAQSGLVRVRKVSWHRLLGWFGAGLATVMVVLGTVIAIIMARFDAVQLHQPGTDAFLAIPFYDMIAFGMCVGLAIYWKSRPEFHRRLMFIGTVCLMDAAVGRFAFMFDHNLFYLCLDLLVALGIARDLIVDGRVHKVYLYSLPLLIVAQNFALYVWRGDPGWWQGITHGILG